MPCSKCTTTPVGKGLVQDDFIHNGLPKRTCAYCGTTYDLHGHPESDNLPVISGMRNNSDGNGLPIRIKEHAPVTQPRVISDRKRQAKRAREELTELMKQMRKDQGGIEAVRKGVFGPAYAELIKALDGLAEIEDGER